MIGPSSTLAHYEIVSALGKGGMGEVYRARDTKLGREVAIKVLPAEFAKDAERLARLEREARMLAALNHPNIGAIYGLEQSEDTRFLVLELVEGDTLAERLARGAIPVEESLKLALQIAEALEAAHQKGVIHRDLKPANIKITPEGRLKVLDFGLAKAFGGDQADVDLSNSPTLSMQATQQGVILGTAAYMSPEQARGGTADHRADIWAFGCVLFEMLTGRPAFDGETISDVLASVLKSEQDSTALPPGTPPRIRFLLERCLEKRRDDRCQGISEVRAELRRVVAGGERPQLQPSRDDGRTTAPTRIAWATAATLAVALVAVLVWRGSESGSSSAQFGRFEYRLPEGIAFRNRAPAAPALAISADGASILYNGTGGLYVRPLDEYEAHLIPGTEGNLREPRFSPDGSEIVFWESDTNELKKMPIGGGQPTKLADLSDYPFGISWTGSTILYGQGDGIWGVPGSGGRSERLIAIAPGEQAAGARFLPGEDLILYSVTTAGGDSRWDQADIVVESVSAPGNRRVILQGGSDPRYLSSGHLVYSREDHLYVSAFDLETLELRGDSVEMIQGVDRTAGRAFYAAEAAYDVSDNGTLIWIREILGTDPDELVLGVGDREGRNTLLTDERRAYRQVRASPVDERFAVEIADTTRAEPVHDIYILEAGNLRRLTFEGTVNRFPAWTPDGQWIVFASNLGGGSLDIYRQRAAGGTGAQLVYASPDPLWPAHVSIDNILAFVEFPDTGTQGDIWTIDLEGGEPQAIADTEAHETNPWFSPDGRALAYQVGNTVWVRSFPGEGEAPQISPGDATTSPIWFSNELVYMRRNPVGLTSIAIETTPSLRFLGPAEPTGHGVNAAVVPGGQLTSWTPASEGRIVAAGFPEAPGGARIEIEVNWFEELKSRVPVR